MNSNDSTKPKTASSGGINKRRAGKLGGSLISLSASAVVAVYAIGYVNTRSSVDQISAAVPATDSPPAILPTAERSVTRSLSPTPVPAAKTSSQGLKDGSYVGSGNSRHGGMQVKVVIANGKISSAAVTSCDTRYPCSDINPLLSEVTARQSVPVDHVSGATDSSNAFKQAVKSALAQATVA